MKPLAAKEAIAINVKALDWIAVIEDGREVVGGSRAAVVRAAKKIVRESHPDAAILVCDE